MLLLNQRQQKVKQVLHADAAAEGGAVPATEGGAAANAETTDASAAAAAATATNEEEAAAPAPAASASAKEPAKEPARVTQVIERFMIPEAATAKEAFRTLIVAGRGATE